MPAAGFDAGIAGGTTGIGPFVTFPVSEVFSFRFGMGFLSLEREQKVETITYDLDVSLKCFPLLLDLNPGRSFFRITGGFFVNQSSADASYIPDLTVEFGGHTYTPDNVGEITGKIRMQPLSPYLGLGFGRPSGSSTGIGFVMDAGVAFTSFDVSLAHEGGNLSPGQEEQLQEDLAMEADSLRDALDGLKIYPVLSAGIIYTW